MYKNAVDLFKELAETCVDEFSKTSLVQAESRNGELRWVSSFGIDFNSFQFEFKLSKDRPEKDVYVASVMQYIAAQIKRSMRADGDQSDTIFDYPVTAFDDRTKFPLQDFRIEPGFIVLKYSPDDF